MEDCRAGYVWIGRGRVAHADGRSEIGFADLGELKPLR